MSASDNTHSGDTQRDDLSKHDVPASVVKRRPRFVILRHDTPPDSNRSQHWDLMLEEAGVLRTWALDEQPQSGVVIKADLLPDHRIAYLDYEGPISGDRGSVWRYDSGSYRMQRETPDGIVAVLTGQRYCGQVEFKQHDSPDQRWTIVFSD